MIQRRPRVAARVSRTGSSGDAVASTMPRYSIVDVDEVLPLAVDAEQVRRFLRERGDVSAVTRGAAVLDGRGRVSGDGDASVQDRWIADDDDITTGGHRAAEPDGGCARSCHHLRISGDAVREHRVRLCLQRGEVGGAYVVDE